MDKMPDSTSNQSSGMSSHGAIGSYKLTPMFYMNAMPHIVSIHMHRTREDKQSSNSGLQYGDGKNFTHELLGISRLRRTSTAPLGFSRPGKVLPMNPSRASGAGHLGTNMVSEFTVIKWERDRMIPVLGTDKSKI